MTDSRQRTALVRENHDLLIEVEALRGARFSQEQQLLTVTRIMDDILLEIESQRNALKKKNKELHELNSYIHRINDTMDSLLVVADLNGKVTQINRAFSEKMEWTQQQLPQLNLDQLFGDVVLDDLEGVANVSNISLCRLVNVLKRQGHLEREMNLNRQHSGLSEAVYLVKGELLHNHQGKLQGIVLTATDITELKQREFALCQSEEALKQAKILADTANKTKGEFLAMMSHEIRTPMNVIIGLTDLVLKTHLSEKQQTYLKNVEVASHSLLRIINDVLDFSKIGAGKLTMESVPFNLEILLDNTRPILGYGAQEKGLKFEVEMPQGLQLNLIGDPLRLQQVLSNLVNNAIKFTDYGSVVLSVLVNSSGVDEIELQFCVSDTGIGITPEQITSLFNPFTQAQSSISRQYGGTGLGLSICKSLVERMDGKIWVISELGRGTKCFFTASFQLTSSDEEVNFASSQREEVGCISLYYGARILIVDDNELNRDLVIALLEQHQFTIDQASNGQEALDAVSDIYYDLILMDIQMPGMDGLEATRRIRQLVTAQKTPIIALSANVMASQQHGYIMAGMDAFITKPVSQHSLLTALVRWLNPRDKSQVMLINPNERSMSKPHYIINIEVAIKRLGVNRANYFRILSKFVNQVILLQQQLGILHSTINFEGYRAKVHEVKGLAGIIGADRLYALCSEIELELKTNKQNPKIFGYDKLVLELTQVVSQADRENESKMHRID